MEQSFKEQFRSLCSRIQGITLCYSVQKNSSCVAIPREALFLGANIFKKFCEETPMLNLIRIPWIYRGEGLQRDSGVKRTFKSSF